MKYTIEELEEQVEGAIRTVRSLAHKVAIERETKTHAIECLKGVNQAYHKLASTFEGRHLAESWTTCREDTCKLAVEQIAYLEGMGLLDSIKG